MRKLASVPPISLTGVGTVLCNFGADRLRMASLEQVPTIFDAGEIGVILIGMPRLEKRLARYPQFYSRIGFVHEFRPLAAKEIRQLLDQRQTPPGVHLPQHSLYPETIAVIIRMTGGNFRLLNRLLTQVERILEINALPSVTKEVVEAARENLVIGQSQELYATPLIMAYRTGLPPELSQPSDPDIIQQNGVFVLTLCTGPVCFHRLSRSK